MRRTLGLLVLGGMASALVACGASDPEATAADAEAKADAARIRFERCMRSNGVDIPEPRADAGRTTFRVDASKMRPAMRKCRKYQEAAFGSITPQQREEFRDAATKFAACMRRHGVDVPDPPSEDADTTKGAPRAGVTRVERESPRSRAAMEACKDKLPKGGPGGGMKLAVPGGGAK